MKIINPFHGTSLGRIHPESGYGDLGEGGIVQAVQGADFSGSPSDGQFPFFNAGSGEIDWLTILGFFGSVISPTQLAADTDNWSPTGLSTSAAIRVALSADHNLTGIVAPASTGVRTVVLLANISAHTLTLKHDATSTGANRFYLPGSADLALGPNGLAVLWYDPTSTRWRVAGGTGGGGSFVVKEDGSTVVAAATGLNFGTGITVTASGTEAEVGLDGAEIDSILGLGSFAFLSSLAHASTTGRTANDHHNQSHVLATDTALGADHTITGGVAGYVLRALTATTAKFMQLLHSDLGSVGADDHHAQAHHAAHQPSGADPMTVDAAAATGSLRTLGGASTQAAAGDHTHTGPAGVPAGSVCELLNGSQATGSAAAWKATFSSEVRDTQNWHSTSVNTSRVTPTAAGSYLVIAVMLYGGLTHSAGRWFDIFLNGNQVAGNYQNATSDTTSAYSCVTEVVCNGTTDYIECGGAWSNVNQTVSVRLIVRRIE